MLLATLSKEKVTTTNRFLDNDKKKKSKVRAKQTSGASTLAKNALKSIGKAAVKKTVVPEEPNQTKQQQPQTRARKLRVPPDAENMDELVWFWDTAAKKKSKKFAGPKFAWAPGVMRADGGSQWEE